MGILFSELPTAVKIGGTSFDINYDFRCMARFENELLKSDVNNPKANSEIVTAAMLDFYKGNVPRDIPTALDEMWRFYRCGEDVYSRINTFGNNSRNERLYDYDVDGARIISAFRTQYGIDLTCEPMHWWLFRSYFRDLDVECRLVRIMSYRCIDLKEIKDSRERARYKKLKEYYKLPTVKKTPLTLEERDALYIKKMQERVNRDKR